MNIKVGKETVLIISDLQAPFEHKDTVKFLTWMKKKYKPTKVVCIGDEIDFHAISKYAKDPDGYGAGNELKTAVEHLQPIYKLFPNVMCCTSNHTDRPYIRAFEAGLPRSIVKDIRDILQAPEGWEWRDKWVIDNVSYIHGHGHNGGQSAIQQLATKYPTSVVFGHVHAHAGLYYRATDCDLKFAMNVGCMINTKAYAFVYGKHMITKPILGCGIVHKGLPTFVPMLLNKNGRWIDRLKH